MLLLAAHGDPEPYNSSSSLPFHPSPAAAISGDAAYSPIIVAIPPTPSPPRALHYEQTIAIGRAAILKFCSALHVVHASI